MSIQRIRRRVDISKTIIGVSLVRTQHALEKSDVGTLLKVRSAGNLQELKRRGFDDADVKTLGECARLARAFPLHGAIALHEAGADSLEQLNNWQSGRSTDAVKNSGAGDTAAAYESPGLERLKTLLNRGTPPDHTDGASIDVDGWPNCRRKRI